MTVEIRACCPSRVVKFSDMIGINPAMQVYILTKIVALLRNLHRLPIVVVTSCNGENQLNRSEHPF